MDRWCAKQSLPRGATLTLDQIWALAQRWYHDRLRAEWRRPTAAEATETLARIGLTGDFWALE